MAYIQWSKFSLWLRYWGMSRLIPKKNIFSTNFVKLRSKICWEEKILWKIDNKFGKNWLIICCLTSLSWSLAHSYFFMMLWIMVAFVKIEELSCDWPKSLKVLSERGFHCWGKSMLMIWEIISWINFLNKSITSTAYAKNIFSAFKWVFVWFVPFHGCWSHSLGSIYSRWNSWSRL